jgi:hypothetical protein
MPQATLSPQSELPNDALQSRGVLFLCCLCCVFIFTTKLKPYSTSSKCLEIVIYSICLYFLLNCELSFDLKPLKRGGEAGPS